jgi:hypothetical protein
VVVAEESLSDNALVSLTSKLTDPAIKNIVNQSIPTIRAIISEERNRLADALMAGIPFLAGAAVMASATYYLAPKDGKYQKAAGYGGASIILGSGAVITLMNLKSQEAAAKAAAQGSTALDPYIQSASQSLVVQAEPRVREIIQEERVRLAGALQEGLPWAAVASIVALASVFLVPDSMPVLKFLGWSGATALCATGTVKSLNGMKGL